MSKLRTYESGRELIDCLVDFHLRVARLAEIAMDQEQDERVRLIFNYLLNHHQQLQESLASYEEDGEASVLDTRFSFVLNEDKTPEAVVESIGDTRNMDFDKAVKLSRMLGEYPVGLLDDVLLDLTVPHAQEVFENLREMEQEEQKLLIRAVNSLKDL